VEADRCASADRSTEYSSSALSGACQQSKGESHWLSGPSLRGGNPNFGLTSLGVSGGPGIGPFLASIPAAPRNERRSKPSLCDGSRHGRPGSAEVSEGRHAVAPPLGECQAVPLEGRPRSPGGGAPGGRGGSRAAIGAVPQRRRLGAPVEGSCDPGRGLGTSATGTTACGRALHKRSQRASWWFVQRSSAQGPWRRFRSPQGGDGLPAADGVRLRA
jgi:hypothetical protein